MYYISRQHTILGGDGDVKVPSIPTELEQIIKEKAILTSITKTLV